MKAAIYSRKSKFTGKGDSIENQVQLCKEYASNLNIDEFYIYEDEGFSGGNIDRPKFQTMLNDAKNKKFDMLICYRLDRVSRNISDFSTLIEELQKLGIAFISIREQFDTSTPMGRAMMYIAGVFAQLERETIAERIRDNMLELAKSGRWLGGQTPLGFNSEKIKYIDAEMNERYMNKLSPVSEELKLVKLLYDKYLKTASIHQVQKFCLENNIKGKNGGQITSRSIGDILRNSVYVKSDEKVFNYLKSKDINLCGTPNGNGMLTYNKRDSKYVYREMSEWIAAVGKHNGIIDSNDWLHVQLLLDKNKKKPNLRQGTSKTSLLSGILKCAKCGSPMRVTYGRHKKDGSARVYYYTCTLKAHSGKTRCDASNVKGDYIEETVVNNIKLDIDKILKMLKSSKEKMAACKVTDLSSKMQNDLDVKNKQMDVLLEQLSKSEGSIAADFIVRKIDELGKEVKDLELKLKNNSALKSELIGKQLNYEIFEKALLEFSSSFELITDISKKRILLETIIDKITWDGETGDIDIKLWGSKKK